MKFIIHQGSRQGPRPYNQDRLAYSYSKEAVLLVIADGMGGHRHGEVAAQLAVNTLTDAFQTRATPLLDDPQQFLSEHIMQVHRAIDTVMALDELLESPRTTIVAAVLQHNKLYCAHVGDSRLYHFRNGRQVYRTEDHSIVQMLYRRGQLDKQHMREHPDRNKIYNCLGGDKTPQIELAPPQPLRDGDTVLLCTDGLWSALSDEEIKGILHANPVNDSVPKLLDMAEALSEKDGDNISAIGLQWGERRSDAENSLAISTITMALDATTTIMNPLNPYSPLPNEGDDQDLTDDEIERAIAEIQAAILKTQR
ncbi:MAG TPA: protein phosphatase 2C domain-containing protein [Methylophilaceae bacterium]|nr:protein phosphatase 2C domain-containing protein [Methylophilaceae bacterium]